MSLRDSSGAPLKELQIHGHKEHVKANTMKAIEAKSTPWHAVPRVDVHGHIIREYGGVAW